MDTFISRVTTWLAVALLSGCAGTVSINPAATMQRKIVPPDATQELSQVTISKSNFGYALMNWPTPIFNPTDAHDSSAMRSAFRSALSAFKANPSYSNFSALTESAKPFVRFLFLFGIVAHNVNFTMPVAKNGANIDKPYWPTPSSLRPVVSQLLLLARNKTKMSTAYIATSILGKLARREYSGRAYNTTAAEYMLLDSTSGPTLAMLMRNYIGGKAIQETGHIFTYKSNSIETHSIEEAANEDIRNSANAMMGIALQLAELPLAVTSKIITGKSYIPYNYGNTKPFSAFAPGFRESSNVLSDYFSAIKSISAITANYCDAESRRPSALFDQDVYIGAKAAAIAYLNDPPRSFSVGGEFHIQQKKYIIDTTSEYKVTNILDQIGFDNECDVHDGRIRCNGLALSMVFFKSTGNPSSEIVAIRGTANWQNWSEDYNQISPALGNIAPDDFIRPEIYLMTDDIIYVLSSIEKNKTITIVGHSLGGGLAQYAGVHNAIPYYTYNPARLTPVRGNNSVTGYNFTSQNATNSHEHDVVSGDSFGVLYGCLYGVPIKFHGHALKDALHGYDIGDGLPAIGIRRHPLIGALVGAAVGAAADGLELHSIKNMLNATNRLYKHDYHYKQVYSGKNRTLVGPYSLGGLLHDMNAVQYSLDYGVNLH